MVQSLRSSAPLTRSRSQSRGARSPHAVGPAWKTEEAVDRIVRIRCGDTGGPLRKRRRKSLQSEPSYGTAHTTGFRHRPLYPHGEAGVDGSGRIMEADR